MSSKRTFKRNVSLEKKRIEMMLKPKISQTAASTSEWLSSCPSEEELDSKMSKNFQTKITLDSVMKSVEAMANKIEALADELKEIKHQNDAILNILAENTAAMKSCLKSNVPKHTKTFPVSSLDGFKRLEESLNEENEKEYIASIRAICGKRGIKKGLRDLISLETLDLFNVDGTHGKLRLLNYPKFMHILFAGTYSEGCTDNSFKNDIRDALKLAKNRHCKEKKKTKEGNEKDFFEKHYPLSIEN